MFVLTLFQANIIYLVIITVILINLACILYLVQRERKKDRKEIEEIVSDMSNMSKKEKEEVVQVKEVEETIPKEPFEIGALLEKMQKDLNTTPEEVVSNFEKDQEEKSIISYQELVNTLKKDKKETLGVKEVKKELTKDMELKKTSPILEKEEIVLPIEEKQPLKKDTIDIIDIEEDNHLSKETTIPKVEEVEEHAEKKFQNTDFISPIFGKMNNGSVYATVRKVSREEKLEELLEEVPKRRRVSLEETLDMKPLREEMRKSDEFLRSLKDFRSNL